MKTKNQFPELKAQELTWHCPDDSIPFESTAECAACEDIIGQEKALKSLETGLNIKSRGYNIFITGLVGTGRTTTIKKFLEKIRLGQPVPDDLLYVNNFKKPEEPILLALPAGQGRRLNDGLERLITMLKPIYRNCSKASFSGKKAGYHRGPAEEAKRYSGKV